MNSNSTAAQRARLLSHLKKVGPKGLTTIHAREELDIMSPAPRVHELRNRGFNIQTIWVTEVNAQGHKHRNALYVLKSSNSIEVPTRSEANL